MTDEAAALIELMQADVQRGNLPSDEMLNADLARLLALLRGEPTDDE